MSVDRSAKSQPLYERLMFFAEGDLAAAEALARSNDPHFQKPCFDARESVEKALKAFLAAAGREVPQIHSLRGLLRDCIAIDKGFSTLQGRCEVLSRYQSEARYPEADVVYEFTAQQATDASQIARKVFDFVREKIDRRRASGLL